VHIGIKQATIGAGLVLWIVAERRLRQELHRNTFAQRKLRRDERVKHPAERRPRDDRGDVYLGVRRPQRR
jgi:hypothetical protein